MARTLHTTANKQFCKLLIAAREDAGLTQSDVAQHLDRPQSFVAKYEGGERRLDVLEFIDVCKAIGVNPPKLLEQFIRKSRP